MLAMADGIAGDWRPGTCGSLRDVRREVTESERSARGWVKLLGVYDARGLPDGAVEY